MEVRIEVETDDGRLPFRILGTLPSTPGDSKQIPNSNNRLAFTGLLEGTPSQWPDARDLQPFKGGFIFTLVLKDPDKLNDAAEWLKEQLYGAVNCVRIGGIDVGEYSLTDTGRYAELLMQAIVKRNP